MSEHTPQDLPKVTPLPKRHPNWPFDPNAGYYGIGKTPDYFSQIRPAFLSQEALLASIRRDSIRQRHLRTGLAWCVVLALAGIVWAWFGNA